MNASRILRIAIVSANDVQAERDTIPQVVEYLNNGIAKDRGLRIEVSRWETEAYPALHVDGPQGAIDEVLRLDQCDLVIGIFWKRFGTPVKGARSGTEHELRIAHRLWKKTGRPQIMLYFNERGATPRSKADIDQWGEVLDFRQEFSEKALWWTYKSKVQFERLLRDHLTKFIRTRFPLHSPINNSELGQGYPSYKPIRRIGFSQPNGLTPAISRRPYNPFTNAVTVTGAAIICISMLLFAFLLTSHRQNQQLQREIARSLNQTDVGGPNTTTIVLEPFVALRGSQANEATVSVLPNSAQIVRLQLKLPKGEDADSYNIRLFDAYGRVLLNVSQLRRAEGSLFIVLNRQWISKGRYRIAVYQNEDLRTYYLFNVSSEDGSLPSNK